MSIIKEQDGFKLELIALEEHTPIADAFDGNDIAIIHTINGVDDGSLMWFTACVIASKCDVQLGFSYLGCCAYASLEDFVEAGYYEDMCNEALEEAKQTLIKLGV